MMWELTEEAAKACCPPSELAEIALTGGSKNSHSFSHTNVLSHERAQIYYAIKNVTVKYRPVPYAGTLEMFLFWTRRA